MQPNDIAVAIDFGLRDAFDLVRRHTAAPKDGAGPCLFLGVYRTTSRCVIPEGECIAFAGPGEYGGLFISMSTRYEDMDGFRVPKELRCIAISHAPDIDKAQHYLYGSVQRFDRVMQLATNASIGILAEALLQEIQPLQFFRQTDYTPPKLPRNGRIVDRTAMQATANALFALPADEVDRFNRATDHYCLSLSHWREGEIPLAMLHLYIGVETICKAVIRNIQRRDGVTEQELYSRYSVASVRYPDTALILAIRNEVIFKGDHNLAKKAGDASNGIEHGFMGWDEVWSFSRSAYVDTAKCLRETLINMLALGADANSLLFGPRFVDVLREEVPYFSHGIYQGDLIERWKELDFRLIDSTPFLIGMEVDEQLGTYVFKFNQMNDFGADSTGVWTYHPPKK